MCNEKPELGIRAFQERIEEIYGERDARRGARGCCLWLVEEIGELARSLLSRAPGAPEEAAEFADCLAWLATLASRRGVDLAAAAAAKYGAGCPRCGATPCRCAPRCGE